ncbi:hypothetical protein TNCV_2612081 [Trichonephila clavipes]|nr:hypothetical protein TNCV_2612081 [Trichonephila clavipes]
MSDTFSTLLSQDLPEMEALSIRDSEQKTVRFPKRKNKLKTARESRITTCTSGIKTLKVSSLWLNHFLVWERGMKMMMSCSLFLRNSYCSRCKNMFHMTTTTGRRHSRRVTNPATAECNMSGCMEDTSLRIAYFSSNRLHGPDRYTRDFKYPHSQKSAGIKSGDRGTMGTCSTC